MVYGYIRVSCKEQNIDRQVDAFAAFEIDKLFIDKQSGKNFERPAYQSNMKHFQDILLIARG